jgi:RNA polymerase sigma-70 factor (ECF subfamily)
MSSDAGSFSNQVNQLLAAARAGDTAALGRLMDVFRTYLRAIADQELAAAVRPKATPSDVVQDTFLEAYRLFERFGGERAEEFRAWLRAILLLKVAEAHERDLAVQKRRADREQSLDQDADSGPLRDALPGSGTTPSTEAMAKEQSRELRAALGRLPEQYRQVIVWRNWDGLPFAEVGRRLNRSEDAARMLFVRALERLQSELERDEPPRPERPG